MKTITESLRDPLLRLSFMCITLMGIAVASIVPFQSVIGIEYLGYSKGAYALITSIGALISVSASVAVGIYTDQTGRYRDILAICNVVGVFAAASVFFLPAKATFMLAHMVLFPISSTTFTQYFAMASLAAKNNERLNKDVSLSMVRASFAGAFGLTPPLLAVAVSAGMELIAVYGVAMVINSIVLLLVVRLWPGDQSSLEEKSGISFFEALRELTRQSILIRVTLTAFIIGVNGLNNILLGLLILNNINGTEADVGWFAGGVALVEAPVMIGIALILKHFTRSAVLLFGCVIYASFLFMLPLQTGMSAAWWLILPAGFGAGILLSVTVGYVQDLVTDRPGAGSSLVAVTHFGGILIASATFAAAGVITDYQGTAWIGAVIAVLSGALLFLTDGRAVRA